ncbi:unnamed protein product [Adineta steineri]|uniref:Uncharacterized protein n=1 Tax=Adineta steineri TaxID=433720 RepID=A0A816C9V4_9BILA|nr:unnamed protein product [Adineta steineri]CAF1619563.1 unnamed protein product [Adineta steineri]
MFWMIVIILSLFSIGDCISIGKIEDYIMIDIINSTLLNISREKCICELVKSNELVSALNYFEANQTCQLFYSNKNSILIQFYINSSLTFINQSSISVTTIQSLIPPAHQLLHQQLVHPPHQQPAHPLLQLPVHPPHQLLLQLPVHPRRQLLLQQPARPLLQQPAHSLLQLPVHPPQQLLLQQPVHRLLRQPVHPLLQLLRQPLHQQAK